MSNVQRSFLQLTFPYQSRQTSRLNDYKPLALTSILAKCLEKLVFKYIRASLLHTPDPFWFDIERTSQQRILHTLLEHLEHQNTYARLHSVIDYSSALMGKKTFSTLVINTGVSQGCVLSLILSTQFTHDCSASFASNLIVKFADDTTVLILITNNDKTNYRTKVQDLASRRRGNNLILNTRKMVVEGGKF